MAALAFCTAQSFHNKHSALRIFRRSLLGQGALQPIKDELKSEANGMKPVRVAALDPP